MISGCDPSLQAKIAERNEKAKKVYRYVSDVSRRIDEAIETTHSIPELFTIKIEVQRQKLRDYCEKLIFLDPINYGKKSLELLWRKVYYDTVSVAKKYREIDSAGDNHLLMHIVCGMGHFHNLITRIQTELNVCYREVDFTLTYHDEECESPTEHCNDFEMQATCRILMHSCLIYLGDLSRYQSEITPAFAQSTAARYYLQAAHIDLTSGMPYNQLGNLFLNKNHNLDSVCYYIHCLSCIEPFEGALGNLTNLLEKNSQYCESFNNDNESLSQQEHVQSMIAQFLSLIELWYLSKNDTNIPERCNMIAHQFKTCMNFAKIPLPDIHKNYEDYMHAIEDETMNPTYLKSEIVHKVVQICLFTIAKLNEVDEKKAFSCKAFTLALLSQLLQKQLQQLIAAGFEVPGSRYSKPTLKTQSSKSEEDTIVEDDTKESNTLPASDKKINNITTVPKKQDEDETAFSDDNNIPSGEIKGTKKSVLKRRRRRRINSVDSSDMSESDDETTESNTENSHTEEESCDSSFDSEDDDKSDVSAEDIETPVTKLNGNTDHVDVEPMKNGLVNGHNKENGDNAHKPKSSATDNPTAEKKELTENDVKHFLQGDNFMSSIKLLQDWTLNEKDLILSCGESGETLFQCIVDLLNIFVFHFQPKHNHDLPDLKILQYAQNVAKNLDLEYKSIPLPEDVNLRGTSICKFDKDAAEWQILNRYQPSEYEENIIRILHFIDFGNQIAKVLPRIRFNRSMSVFYLKKLPKPKAHKVSTKPNHKKTREWHNSKKQVAEATESGLLRRLGRLWLASRVQELERSGRAAATPTLLVLDAAALHRHLKKIKQLIKAQVFVLLVPNVVVQELDELKREESAARDAIRWLETQLQGGSRFVRPQRAGQSRPLPLLKCPRKAPPHVHNFIQILEFCHHFVADEQGGRGDPDASLTGQSAPLLVLLTGNEPGTEEPHKEFSVSGAAHSAGVAMEYIGHFYAKWRQAAHKGGHKR